MCARLQIVENIRFYVVKPLMKQGEIGNADIHGDTNQVGFE